MQNDQIQLSVYTPQGSVVSEPVKSVTLQAADGEIGIFPLHVRYIGALGDGILKYQKIDGSTKALSLSGGFCRFVDNHLDVLSEAVEAAS